MIHLVSENIAVQMIDQDVFVARECLVEPGAEHHSVVVVSGSKETTVEGVVVHRPMLGILPDAHAMWRDDADIVIAEHFQTSFEGDGLVF